MHGLRVQTRTACLLMMACLTKAISDVWSRPRESAPCLPQFCPEALAIRPFGFHACQMLASCLARTAIRQPPCRQICRGEFTRRRSQALLLQLCELVNRAASRSDKTQITIHHYCLEEKDFSCSTEHHFSLE
ncbi:hypothetical protein J6590_004049 [Homalodisca vitripennis]|nr:hypothetical protein J6590_004049 [Homalodisca vitripennis]